jgi:hypothetical protein
LKVSAAWSIFAVLPELPSEESTVGLRQIKLDLEEG